jgi:ATP-dependent DNA helicase RecG
MTASSSIAEDVKPLSLKSPISAMAGIGPKRAEALADRGISTVEDLLFHLPARYQDWRERRTIAQLEAGIVAIVEGTRRPFHPIFRCACMYAFSTAFMRD